jgi:hypothetical protein
MASSGPHHLEIRWMKPKCDSTLPVVNYSVSVIPFGAESGSTKQVSHSMAAEKASVNITEDLFQLRPCTDYIVSIRPLFPGIQWSG